VHRHAQPVPKDVSLLPALIRVAAIVAFGAAIIAGGWWLWPGSPVHPQARYLPENCDLFVSVHWQQLAKTGWTERRSQAPGLVLVDRCGVFLHNAKLQAGDIQRINAGRPAGGNTFVVVYRLTRPIDPEEVMGKNAFDDYGKEKVRGKTVYTLAGSAIAFPEENLIVNGPAELVQSAVRRRGKTFSGPLSPLLETLDFSATCVVVTPGLPSPLENSYLQGSANLASSVQGTVDTHEYGQTIQYLRSLRLGENEEAASQLQQSLQQSITSAAEDPENPKSVRKMLASVQVSAAAGEVTIQLDLDADQLTAENLQALNQLY
jgi:hypothetical protein